MGKGEIARYEQFLLFLQCFQKACFPGVSKGVIVWEWVKEICLKKTIPGFSLIIVFIHLLLSLFTYYSEEHS